MSILPFVILIAVDLSSEHTHFYQYHSFRFLDSFHHSQFAPTDKIFEIIDDVIRVAID